MAGCEVSVFVSQVGDVYESLINTANAVSVIGSSFENVYLQIPPCVKEGI